MKAMLVDEKQNLVWSDVADPIINDDEVYFGKKNINQLLDILLK